MSLQAARSVWGDRHFPGASLRSLYMRRTLKRRPL